MAKNHYLSEMFWVDEYIAELDPSEKLLFNYLLTNHFINCYGIYQIPLRNIAFDTGIDKDAVLRILERFNRDNKISYWDGKYIVIHNFYKFQSYNLREVRDFVLRSLNDLPNELRLIYPDVIQNLKGRVLASERPGSAQSKPRKTPAGNTNLIQSNPNETDLYQSSSPPPAPQGGRKEEGGSGSKSGIPGGQAPQTPRKKLPPDHRYEMADGVFMTEAQQIKFGDEFGDDLLTDIPGEVSDWAKDKGIEVKDGYTMCRKFALKHIEKSDRRKAQ